MNTNRKNKELALIIVLGLLTALGPLSIDLYLPAFQQIARELQTDVATIAYSLSSFFVGLAVGQMIYGPLLERFGRKRPMYVGLVIYAIASLGCAMAVSVEQLILFRFLQALGSCAGLVASRAIIRDLFEGKKMAQVFSSLIMVVAISPIIAPTVGGLLSTYSGWQSVFIILVGLAMVILTGAIIILPETKQPDVNYSLNLSKILGNYLSIIKHPVFFVNAFTGAIAYAGLYAYISGSPHLYMELLGLNEQQYGWIFAIIATGLISATQVNNRLLQRTTSERIILVSLFAHSGMGILLLAITLVGITGIIIDTALIFGFLLFIGFILPNASALSLGPMGHTAGSASALMGAIQMSVGAGGSFMVGLFQSETAIPMALVMAFCGSASLGLFYFGNKWLEGKMMVQSV
ncbi:MAG: multidrug effflux MFS transporter [Bacteroidetes bacterium]|nr:multidrug effflux MFS transporter [Bacteroidota bacterium]